jgi:NAD-dependent dihydropyrimidine dehydrogenase PreA subunit
MLACPTKQIRFSGQSNSFGYNHAVAANEDCRGCAFCFYACPEPDAIRVFPGGAQETEE